MKAELRAVENDTELVVRIPKGTKFDVNALLMVLIPSILNAILEYFQREQNGNA